MIKISLFLCEFLIKETDLLIKFLHRYNQNIEEISTFTFTSIYHEENVDNLNTLVLRFYKQSCLNNSKEDLVFINSILKQATGDNLINPAKILEEDLKSLEPSTEQGSPFQAISNKKKIFIIEKIIRNPMRQKKRTPRNSQYRGVSKNGSAWQVIKVYDFYALKHYGFKAKTNFYYTDEEKEALILKNKIDFN